MNDLSLPEFNILKKEGNKYDYLFTVELKKRPDFCIHCMWDEFTADMFEESKGKRFKVHETRERMVTDLDMHRKRVKIKIIHKRYKCPLCGKTFFELLDSVDTNGKITKRLYEYLQEESLEPFRTFTDIAEDFGISSMTVRRAFDDYVKEKEQNRVLKAPRVIGIDEAHLNEIMRGVITDIENKRLLEVLPNNTKRDVKKCIKSMDGYKNIEIACMDMATGYRYAMKELVPNAFCVIDKFHVIQCATKAMESVRVEYKKSLPIEERRLLMQDRWILTSNKEDLKPKHIEKRNMWFERHTPLMIAYWLKEGLRDIYLLSKDRKEAFERYYEWECAIPKDFTIFKEKVQDTINDCKTEVFNYFLHRYTNAYTESINNVIKKIEKVGVGYSFDVLRAKALYGTTATEKPEWGTLQFYAMEHMAYKQNHEPILTIRTDYNNLIKGFGVDIFTLERLIDEGKF